MTVSGTSFDADSGVDLVGVQIQRRDVSPIQYWDGQVWTAANPAIVAASVSANGSSWNLPNVDLTNAGSYRIRLRVQDNAGNLSLGGANLITNFIVDNPDNTAPNTTLESHINFDFILSACLLYTSPSPRDATLSRMPSSA